MQAVLSAAIVCITLQFLYFVHTAAEMQAKAPAQTKRAGSIDAASNSVESSPSPEEAYAVASVVLRAHKDRSGGRSPIPACQCTSLVYLVGFGLRVT